MKLDGALQESNSRMAEWDALVSFPPREVPEEQVSAGGNSGGDY